MKVIRIAQAALRHSTPRSFTLNLNSKLKLEAIPPKIMSHPSDRSQKLKGLAAWLLPEGYPRTVHQNYLNYSFWNSIQGISTSFIGVISTQAMLGTLMKISGNEPGWLSQGTAAATINWILKDGLGQAGGIAVMAFLGSRLDSQARNLRFRSSIFFLIGAILELSIPLAYSALPAFSDSGWLFVALASAANVLKNVSWMLVSATRAHFMKNFALKDNLGDLTGKAASQMTLASLLGTGMGLLALKSEMSLTNPSLLIGFAWAINAAVCMAATLKTCKYGLSRQLDSRRIFDLVEGFGKHCTGNSNISRYIWTPELVAERESFIWIFKRKNEPKININAPLNILNEEMNWIVPLDLLEDNKYCIAKKDTYGSYYIWTLKGSTSKELIGAVTTAALDKLSLKDVAASDILEAFKSKGWDLESFHVDEENCLQIETSKED